MLLGNYFLFLLFFIRVHLISSLAFCCMLDTCLICLTYRFVFGKKNDIQVLLTVFLGIVLCMHASLKGFLITNLLINVDNGGTFTEGAWLTSITTTATARVGGFNLSSYSSITGSHGNINHKQPSAMLDTKKANVFEKYAVLLQTIVYLCYGVCLVTK